MSSSHQRARSKPQISAPAQANSAWLHHFGLGEPVQQQQARPAIKAGKQTADSSPARHESENTEDQPTHSPQPTRHSSPHWTGQTLVRNVVSPICRRWLASLSGPQAVPSLAAPWRAHNKGSKGSGQDQLEPWCREILEGPKHRTAPAPPTVAEWQFEALAGGLADGKQPARPPLTQISVRATGISTHQHTRISAGRYREPTALPLRQSTRYSRGSDTGRKHAPWG